jgi:hypothetical protein
VRIPALDLSAADENIQPVLWKFLSRTARGYCASFRPKYQVEWLSSVVRSALVELQNHLSKPQAGVACFGLAASHRRTRHVGSGAAATCCNHIDLQRLEPTYHLPVELPLRPSTTRFPLDGKEKVHSVLWSAEHDKPVPKLIVRLRPDRGNLFAGPTPGQVDSRPPIKPSLVARPRQRLTALLGPSAVTFLTEIR